MPILTHSECTKIDGALPWLSRKIVLRDVFEQRLRKFAQSLLGIAPQNYFLVNQGIAPSILAHSEWAKICIALT